MPPLAWRRTTPLVFPDHFAQVCSWPNLEGADFHARVPRHQFDSVIQVVSLENKDPAELLLGLGERTIRDEDLATVRSQGPGGAGFLQGFSTREMAVRA